MSIRQAWTGRSSAPILNSRRDAIREANGRAAVTAGVLLMNSDDPEVETLIGPDCVALLGRERIVKFPWIVPPSITVSCARLRKIEAIELESISTVAPPTVV